MNRPEPGTGFWRLIARLIGPALAFIAVLTACGAVRQEGASPSSETTRPQELRAGVGPSLPPLMFREGGEFTGLEADLVKALAREMGREVKFVGLERENLLSALLENRIDLIVSALPVNEANTGRMALTEPYLKSGQMALARREYILRHPSLPGLVKAAGRVAVESGSVGETLVREAFTNSKVLDYPSAESAARAVVDKKADVFVHEATYVIWISQRLKSDEVVAIPMLLTADNYAIGLRREDETLLRLLNASLKNLTDSGRLAQIIKRWLPYTQ
ncbi:MAG: transporter substrate-binding domain-containing protein [Thermodesulfobacteriota bacterium]